MAIPAPLAVRRGRNRGPARIRPVAERETTDLRRRRTRLRSTALPTFLVTVKPTRIGPLSPRFRACNTKAAVGALAPVAAATKSARCLSRSMGAPHAAYRDMTSGAEPLAALGAPLRDDLAAAFGRHPGAITVTALAHELARLIGPLHGSVSAGRASAVSTVGGPAAGRAGRNAQSLDLSGPAAFKRLAAYKGGRPCSSMRWPVPAA